MDLEKCFPVWDRLTDVEKELMKSSAVKRKVEKGRVLSKGSGECLGLVIVTKGQLRAFILSEGGREITLFRLFELDFCLFTASCIFGGMHFDVSVEAEKDTEFWLIPPNVYQSLMESSAAVANYTNKLMSSRFADVMWLMEQTLFTSFDKRLAAFLLEESAIEGSDRLTITHERIANHLGSAREVVTRMLKYFQNEGAVKLSRGAVEITDGKKLAKIAGE